MKVFIRTGGSTKGIKMMGASKALSEKHTFDMIASASVTAITCVLEALKKYDIIEEAMMSFSSKNMFGKYNPFMKKSIFPSLRAWYRLLSGRESLGKFDELRETIKNYMTPSLFYEWKFRNKTELLVYCFCLEDNEIVEFNLRDFSYTEALDIMIASSAVPIIINSMQINGKHYCDIGFFHPNGSFELTKKYKNIKTIISMYNREEKDKKFPFIYRLREAIFPLIKQKEFYDSKLTEEMEIEYCKNNNIKYKSICIGKTEVSSYGDAGTSSEKEIDWYNGYNLNVKTHNTYNSTCTKY